MIPYKPQQKIANSELRKIRARRGFATIRIMLKKG
jgi:hypothetical protein